MSDPQSPFSEASPQQKEKFLEIAGYPLPSEHKSRFQTDRPFNKPWNLSPYTVSYQFHPSTGYLFLNLTHRMTNNYAIGWDQQGNNLEKSIVNAIYPDEIEQMLASRK
jgi:hypothetical protein